MFIRTFRGRDWLMVAGCWLLVVGGKVAKWQCQTGQLVNWQIGKRAPCSNRDKSRKCGATAKCIYESPQTMCKNTRLVCTLSMGDLKF